MTRLPVAIALLIVAAVALTTSAQGQCPNIPSQGAGFAQGANVTVYIDTSSAGFNQADASAINVILNNWNKVLAVTLNTVYSTTGVPATAGTMTSPIWKVSIGTQTAGYTALTSQTTVTGQTGSSTVTTVFQPSFVSTGSAADVSNLMGHEIVHPFWEGECVPTAAVTCAGVAANQTNNTVVKPSSCDLAAIKANYTLPAPTGTNTGGGSGTNPGGGVSCPGAPENDTCNCDGTNWVCACTGSPYTCADGSESECDGGQWSCPTVTTSQCDGAAPCQGAVCVGTNQWDTSGCPTSCSDVCDPSCSNYNPSDPSCGGGGTPPGGGDPGPGGGDPGPGDPGGGCDYPDDYCDDGSDDSTYYAVLRDLVPVGTIVLATALPLIGLRKRKRDEDSQ